MDARLIRIERVIENESLIELSTQLTQLQAETASLRGEIETLRYESENSATRDRDLYLDVDTRLQNLERGGQTRAGRRARCRRRARVLRRCRARPQLRRH
jgi:TolA-binding protein